MIISSLFRSKSIRKFSSIYQAVSKSDEGSLQFNEVDSAIVMKPLNYFFSTPAFNLYSRYGESINHWVNIPDEKMQKINELSQILYGGITILDDMIDKSVYRYNQLCAHNVFGTQLTANAGCLGINLALQKAIELLPLEGANIFATSINEFLTGTGMEMWRAKENICPTYEEYFGYIVPKNYGFFNLQARLVQECGKNTQDFSKLCELICIFYQVSNDYSDIVGNSVGEGKSLGEEMTEGKFTFPNIHAIKIKGCTEILDILHQKSTDLEVKRRYLSILKELGSVKYTLDFLEQHYINIKNELDKFGGNPRFEKEFDLIMKAIR